MAETTKTAGTTSQTAQLPGAEFFKKMTEEQTHRMTQLFEEAGKLHAQWAEYGTAQLGEMSTLAKNQFKYANDLAADWRRMSMDASKKAFGFFG